MSVAGRGKKRKGMQDRNDVVRRDVLKGLCCAAAAVAAAPVVRGAKVWAALSPPAGEFETRVLGGTGIRVATVGMGAMITRDPDVIRYAVDHGVNYVDTADCYMGGENERIVGRALEGVREKVVLASKVHIAPVDQMIASVENSLRSLRTDVIDIMQLHGIKSEGEVADEGAREALRKLLDQGKIRVPGVTTHSGQEEVLSAVGKQEFYRTVLVAYNFRSDTGIKAAIKNVFGSGNGLSATIRETAAKGIGIIAMKTQAGGYSVPQGSLSPHQAALAWVLENPGVATTIPSMVSFSQVDENMKASGKRLGWGGEKGAYPVCPGNRRPPLRPVRRMRGLLPQRRGRPVGPSVPHLPGGIWTGASRPRDVPGAWPGPWRPALRLLRILRGLLPVGA